MFVQEGMSPGFYETQERAFHKLEMMDKIVIAVLHGYCLGGGLQLAIACDIRICSSDCRLGLPAMNEGLIPGMAPFRLPRLIGLGPARRLILTGEIIEPDESLRLGLVDHLVPADQFETGLAELVQQYLAAPVTAAIAAKRLFRQAFEPPFEAVYETSRQLIVECLASPEVATAKAAWVNRRARRSS
jgi:enoyl-CoA hydratase/carnithine racemase